MMVWLNQREKVRNDNCSSSWSPPLASSFGFVRNMMKQTFLSWLLPRKENLIKDLSTSGLFSYWWGQGLGRVKQESRKPTWCHHHRGQQDLTWQHPLRRHIRSNSIVCSRDQEGSWYSRVPSPVVQAYHKGCKLPCTFGCAVGDRPGCSGSQCDGWCHRKEMRSAHTCASRLRQCCLERRWARMSSDARVFTTPGTKIWIFLK